MLYKEAFQHLPFSSGPADIPLHPRIDRFHSLQHRERVLKSCHHPENFPGSFVMFMVVFFTPHSWIPSRVFSPLPFASHHTCRDSQLLPTSGNHCRNPPALQEFAFTSKQRPPLRCCFHIPACLLESHAEKTCLQTQLQVADTSPQHKSWQRSNCCREGCSEASQTLMPCDLQFSVVGTCSLVFAAQSFRGWKTCRKALADFCGVLTSSSLNF